MALYLANLDMLHSNKKCAGDIKINLLKTHRRILWVYVVSETTIYHDYYESDFAVPARHFY